MRAPRRAPTVRGGFSDRVAVDDPRPDPRAGDLGDEVRGAVRREPRQLAADPLFVAHARLRAQPEATRRVADGRAVEDGRLEDHRRSCRSPTSVRGTAHDPGQADRALAIGDDAASARRASAATWSMVSSASPSRPRRTTIRPVRDRVGVVGVLRLPELVHHVVRDVDDGADRSHAGRQRGGAASTSATAPFAHPREPARREARAELRLIDLERDVVGGRLSRLADRDVVGQRTLAAGEGRDLARQADHRQRVAAVRLHVDVEHRLADDRARGRCPSGCSSPVPRMWIPSASVPRPSSSGAAQHPVD